MLNFLDVGDGSGWGAKDIGDAAISIGKSGIGIGVLVIAGLYVFGRYVVQPYFAGRSKGKE